MPPVIAFCLIPPLGTVVGTILYLILMGVGLLLAGYFFGGIARRVLLPGERA